MNLIQSQILSWCILFSNAVFAGGGVMGSAGRLAAQTVIHDIKNVQKWISSKLNF